MQSGNENRLFKDTHRPMIQDFSIYAKDFVQ